jgi:hypothetical protein
MRQSVQSHWSGNLCKFSVAQILKELQGLAVTFFATLAHFGIDMPVGIEQVFPSVVVVIQKECCPAEIGNGAFADTRLKGNIAEQSLSIVVVQHVIIIGKGRDVEVGSPVVIVIARGNAHT